MRGISLSLSISIFERLFRDFIVCFFFFFFFFVFFFFARAIDTATRRALGKKPTVCREKKKTKTESAIQTLKPLSAEPEITERALAPADRFVILGCDGIWDVASNEKAVEVVAAAIAKGVDAAKALVKFVSDNGSTDNMTAIIVHLVH